MEHGAEFYAEKAKMLLDSLPRSSGGSRIRKGVMKWIARETDMEITGSYLHSLAGGAISSPGEDKLEALAQAMGFPMEWWDEPVELGAPGLREELQEVKVEAVMARLTFVPPERRAKVLERISQLIDEVQEEG